MSRKLNQNEFAWQNTTKLTTHLILALRCFLFFQANFIPVPFPTHRQQVPPINYQCIFLLAVTTSYAKYLIGYCGKHGGRLWASADPVGWLLEAKDARPLWSNFFQFHAVFDKNFGK